MARLSNELGVSGRCKLENPEINSSTFPVILLHAWNSGEPSFIREEHKPQAFCRHIERWEMLQRDSMPANCNDRRRLKQYWR